MEQRARTTLHALLRDRGYKTVRDLPDGNLRAVQGPRDKSASILVVFITQGKLGIKPLRALADTIDTEDHLIIVYNRTITSFARQEFDRMQEAGKHVETFDVHKLQFNLMDHVLVPPHMAATPTQARSRGLVPDKLPIMLRSDPVARWFDWGKGTIVKVTLSSPEGHSMDEYRIVQ